MTDEERQALLAEVASFLEQAESMLGGALSSATVSGAGAVLPSRLERNLSETMHDVGVLLSRVEELRR